MSKVVFISHAGADTPHAREIARLLTEAGIGVRFDRQELCLGDSFLSFMEDALSQSDYCLLLWSRSASETPWVKLEWEAALYRSVQEKRSFLLAGRLEDVPLPSLIAPRLLVDLFPHVETGVARVVEAWRADRSAEVQTQRPVASAATETGAYADALAIYLTSDAFGITVPLKAGMKEPAGVLLDRVIASFKLPKSFDHEGRIGVRFDYWLRCRDRILDRAGSLASQGVAEDDVVSLQMTMIPYSLSEPVEGTLSRAVFRAPSCSGGKSKNSLAEATRLARGAYLSAIVRNGLGP